MTSTTVNQSKSKSNKPDNSRFRSAGRDRNHNRPKPKVVVSARITGEVAVKLQSYAVEAGHLSVSQAVAEILQKFVERKRITAAKGSK